MEYCSSLWDEAGQTILGKLDKVQNRAIRLLNERSATDDSLILHDRRNIASLSLMYWYFYGRYSWSFVIWFRLY